MNADRRLAEQLRGRGWVAVEPGSPLGSVVPISDPVIRELNNLASSGRPIGGFSMEAVGWARRILEAAGCVVPLHAFEVQRAQQLRAEADRLIGR